MTNFQFKEYSQFNPNFLKLQKSKFRMKDFFSIFNRNQLAIGIAEIGIIEQKIPQALREISRRKDRASAQLQETALSSRPRAKRPSPWVRKKGFNYSALRYFNSREAQPTLRLKDSRANIIRGGKMKRILNEIAGQRHERASSIFARECN